MSKDVVLGRGVLVYRERPKVNGRFAAVSIADDVPGWIRPLALVPNEEDRSSGTLIWRPDPPKRRKARKP